MEMMSKSVHYLHANASSLMLLDTRRRLPKRVGITAVRSNSINPLAGFLGMKLTGKKRWWHYKQLLKTIRWFRRILLPPTDFLASSHAWSLPIARAWRQPD